MQYKVFGCKVNKYYTDRWLGSSYLRDKSGIFVASCVVTDNAKRKWIRFVKKQLGELSGSDKIFISGCGAFKDGKAQNNFFELYPELSPNQDKIEVLDEEPQDSTSPQIQDKEVLHEAAETSSSKIDLSKLGKLRQTQIYTKKFILVQGGCDSFCTFCLTVQKRGRHYFRSQEDILEEILDFEATGGKEVVITGVNLAAWGLKTTNDIQSSRFAELIEYLLEHSSIPRLRISSLGPEFVDERVIALFENERIYPHAHFSIQSGSSEVLKAMARHYDAEHMRSVLTKLRNLKRDDGVDISIGADLIVGFPGETDENFRETLSLVRDFHIEKLHAFPFSAHTLGESVPAGKFKKQVPEHIKKERMSELTALGDTVRSDFIASQKGKVFKVLVEKVNGESFSGWSENYIEIGENNFEIISGHIQKNSIIVGKLK